MNCKKIIYAVTMLFPSSKWKYKTNEKLLPKIVTVAKEQNFESIALPLLGTGTGRSETKTICELYEKVLIDCYVEFQIYISYKDCKNFDGKYLIESEYKNDIL